jgi:hypothetical protein
MQASGQAAAKRAHLRDGNAIAGSAAGFLKRQLRVL